MDSMEFHAIHGSPLIPWNSMDSMESFECMESMEFHGIHGIHDNPWNSIESMEFRGIPLDFLEFHGIPRVPWDPWGESMDTLGGPMGPSELLIDTRPGLAQPGRPSPAGLAGQSILYIEQSETKQNRAKQ